MQQPAAEQECQPSFRFLSLALFASLATSSSSSFFFGHFSEGCVPTGAIVCKNQDPRTDVRKMRLALGARCTPDDDVRAATSGIHVEAGNAKIRSNNNLHLIGVGQF